MMIDLGEVREVKDAPRQVHVPKWTAWKLLPLLLLLLLAGAAAPRPLLTQVATFGGNSDPSSIRLIEGALLKRETNAVVVVELDGRERWRVGFDAVEPGFNDLRVMGDIVTVLDADDNETGYTTTAFDLATGQRRWQLPGWIDSIGNGFVQWGAHTIRVYDLDGQRMRWETVPFLASNADFNTGSLYVLAMDGRLIEYDLPSGDVRRSRQVDLLNDLEVTHIEVGVEQVAVVMLSAQTDHGTVTIDRRTFEPSEPDPNQLMQHGDCGPVVCASSIGGEALTSIVDKDSSQVLWSVPAGQTVSKSGVGDSLLVTQYTEASFEHRVVDLVDPITGHSRRAVTGGWRVVVQRDGQMSPVWLARRKDGSTVVARFSEAGITALGSVPGELFDCQYVQPWLSCQTGGGKVGVWRLSP